MDSTDGKPSRESLAHITGMQFDSPQDAAHGPIKSSGRWQVDVNFTAEMAEEFMKDIQSEKTRDVSVFESRRDDRNNLRAARRGCQGKTFFTVQRSGNVRKKHFSQRGAAGMSGKKVFHGAARRECQEKKFFAARRGRNVRKKSFSGCSAAGMSGKKVFRAL